jgi:hypothetical protein
VTVKAVGFSRRSFTFRWGFVMAAWGPRHWTVEKVAPRLALYHPFCDVSSRTCPTTLAFGVIGEPPALTAARDEHLEQTRRGVFAQRGETLAAGLERVEAARRKYRLEQARDLRAKLTRPRTIIGEKL